jgi:hypothetical protein
MSDDEAKTSPRLFDVRTIDRNIRKGLTTRKDYDKYLKSLPDIAEKAAPTETGSVDLDDDDFDDEDDDFDDEDDDIIEEPAAAAAPAAAAPAESTSNHVSDGHGSPPSNDTNQNQ